MSRRRTWVLVGAMVGSVGLASPGRSAGQGPTGPASKPAPQALAFRLDDPGGQVEAILGWFRGARASSPSAALSAFKRASRDPNWLGKPAEALIAMINPSMVAEYRLLDDAELTFRLGEGGRTDWSARIPRDDGTIAAAGPAMALSEGGKEPDLEGRPVDRIGGKPGSTIIGSKGGVLALSNARAGLLEAWNGPVLSPFSAEVSGPGLLARAFPESSPNWASPVGRRLAAVVEATACRSVEGRLRVEGGSIVATASGRFDRFPWSDRPIDPTWLELIPGAHAALAFAIGVDPAPEAVARAFDLADRVEKSDPSRANMAPIRLRLGLAARAAGVRLDADVFPHLIGLSGWFGPSTPREFAAVGAIHLDDEAAAIKLADALLARFPNALPRDDPADKVANRPPPPGRVSVSRRGKAVLVGSSVGALGLSLDAMTHPDRSARTLMWSGRRGQPVDRVAAFWPTRIPDFLPPDPSVAASVATMPPIRWTGTTRGDISVDEVWVDGIDGAIRAFLDRIPLAEGGFP